MSIENSTLISLNINFSLKISKWKFQRNFFGNFHGIFPIFSWNFLCQNHMTFQLHSFHSPWNCLCTEQKENEKMKKGNKNQWNEWMNEWRCWSIIPWYCDAVDVMVMIMMMMMMKTNYMLGFNVFGYFVNGPNIK